MKAILSAITIFALGLILVAPVGAGPRWAAVMVPRGSSGVAYFSAGVPNRFIAQRQFYRAYPYSYYQPYYPQVVVVSPYAPSYILPPAVVVSEPYFCVLHNQGFVSQVGLVDHLAGTHKIPIDAAMSLCPDGVGNCVFPSY